MTRTTNRIATAAVAAFVALVATLLVATLATVPAAADDTFPDVPADYESGPNPHHDNVSDANDLGIFLGDTDGNFNPSDPIRRDQAATATIRTLNVVDDRIAAATNLGAETDGPYPSTAGLGTLEGQGDSSTGLWPADDTLHRSWVQCAPGKIAVGGGFGKNTTIPETTTIVGSFPAGITDGEIVSESGAYIGSEFDSGDAANSMVGQNGWVVEGYNGGESPVEVRPYVICING